ncbi:MAG: hypothetical protein JWN43_1687, partial [Gammaproteobacteria bacterium]|nr:hypothetical protein [Gammaproteobacteria bacterium]
MHKPLVLIAVALLAATAGVRVALAEEGGSLPSSGADINDLGS